MLFQVPYLEFSLVGLEYFLKDISRAVLDFSEK